MNVEKHYIFCIETGESFWQWNFYQNKIGGTWCVGRSFLKCFFRYWAAWVKNRSWKLWFTADPQVLLILAMHHKVCVIEERMKRGDK